MSFRSRSGRERIYCSSPEESRSRRCGASSGMCSTCGIGSTTLPSCTGARSVADLVYKQELDEWSNRPDLKLVTTVDPGGETPAWKGKVGFVPKVLQDLAPSSSNTIAIVLRSAGDDKIHLPRPRKPRFYAPGNVYDIGEQNEVRRRQMRPLYRRAGVRLQRRTRLYLRTATAAAGRILMQGCTKHDLAECLRNAFNDPPTPNHFPVRPM